MEPFLEVPMCIVNTEKEEKVVHAQILPSEIAYHYPGLHWGVVCVMKSGSSFLVNLTPDVFDTYLAQYAKAVQVNGDSFGVVRLTTKPKLHGAD